MQVDVYSFGMIVWMLARYRLIVDAQPMNADPNSPGNKGAAAIAAAVESPNKFTVHQRGDLDLVRESLTPFHGKTPYDVSCN